MKNSLPGTASLCALLAALTCTRQNSLYDPTGAESARCFAFVYTGDIGTTTLADTASLSVVDTFHTGDSVTFVGLVSPPDAELHSLSWDFGDGESEDGAVCRHAYGHGGVYRAVFTIVDKMQNSLSDTVVVYVNTPPRIDSLVAPADNASGILPNDPRGVRFEWSVSDADSGDTVRIGFYINIDTIFLQPNVIDILAGTIDYKGTLSILQRYYWRIVARDCYGDSDTSRIYNFTTKDPNAVDGSLKGYAFFQGWQDHHGILISIKAPGIEWLYDTTDANGFYEFSHLTPKEYTVYATDGRKAQFVPDTTVATVVLGDIAQADTLRLTDPYSPVISGQTPVVTQTVRRMTVSAAFSDSGSGILANSARMTVNDSDVTAKAVSGGAGILWTPSKRLADGAYRILAAVSDSAGNRDSLSWTFTVDAMKLVAMQDTVVRINDTVYLHGEVNDVYSTVAKYKWDFDGNGTWDDSIATTDSTVITPHVYTHEGSYKAVLYSRDDSGMVKTDTVNIQVHNDNPVILAVNGDTTISIKDSVTFNVNATDYDGRIVEMMWDFDGDGTTDFTSATVTTCGFRYMAAGVYRAALMLKDDDQKTTPDTVTVTVVQDAPIVNAGKDTTVSINDTVRLHASATQQFGTIVEWAWDIGNTGSFKATSKGDTNVVAPAAANPNYLCMLRVTDDDGNVAKDTVKVDVHQGVPVAMAGIDTAIYNGGVVHLHGAAVDSFGGTIVAWEWKCGDAAFVVTPSGEYSVAPTVTYNPAWLCILRVTDDDGNISLDTVKIDVGTFGQRLITGGTFNMGQTGIAEPVHQVTVSNFLIDTTEVTQRDYLLLMHVNPSYFTGDLSRPVENATWFDAILYCNARSKRDGKDTVYGYSGISGTYGAGCSGLTDLVIDLSKEGYRLPTEAEWEYACRAGTTTTWYWGNDSSAGGAYAWSSGNSGGTTHPVATKQANVWGLYDMAGNVYEWCHDWNAGYGSEAETDPIGPGTGSYRVVRGGSWSNVPQRLRCASRYGNVPEYRYSYMGFRCVCSR